MRRLLALSAIAAVGFTTFAASRPAEAAYHLIRWQDTGFCQIWDENVPTAPYPSNYSVIVGSEAPTFGDALWVKEGMLRSGACSF